MVLSEGLADMAALSFALSMASLSSKRAAVPITGNSESVTLAHSGLVIHSGTWERVPSASLIT